MRRWGRASLCAVLLLAGCGGSPLSPGDLRSQASRICSASSRQIAEIAAPASPGQTKSFLARGIAALDPELSQLRALEPPAQDATLYRASVRAHSQQLSHLKDALGHLRGGEDPAIVLKTLQQRIAPLQSQENGGWQALQIPACLSR